MICILICQICRLGSVDRALHYTIRRLPVLIQAGCFCPSGKSARTLNPFPKPVENDALNSGRPYRFGLAFQL